MKPGDDRELAGWIDTWKAEPGPPEAARAAILRRVKRRSRNLLLAVAGDVVITIGVLVYFVPRMVRSGHPADIAGATAVALLTAVALVFGLLNRRGLWRPADTTTAAFLDLAELRCRRSLRLVRFSGVFLAVEIALLAPWLWSLIGRRPGYRPFGIDPWLFTGLWFAVICAPIVGWLVWYGRRVRREAAELVVLRRALEE